MMPPIRKRVLGLGGGAAAQAAAWAARLPTLSDQVLEIAVPVGQAGELASVEQMVAGHVHGSACPLRTADIFVDEVEHRQQLGLLAHIENKVGKQAARIGAGAVNAGRPGSVASGLAARTDAVLWLRCSSASVAGGARSRLAICAIKAWL